MMPSRVFSQGAEVLGNLNAPPAVTASAVIYALRCLLPGDAADVPLNQVSRPCHVMIMTCHDKYINCYKLVELQ